MNIKDNTDQEWINHPDHYTIGGIESIDVLKSKSTPEEFKGHLRLTALAYIQRAPFKGEILKDLKKARWYLNLLITEIERDHFVKEDLSLSNVGRWISKRSSALKRGE